MVIELTDGLARCSSEKMGELSVSIENLLIGYYEGNHILLISIALCGYIRDHHLYKSDRAEKALNTIEENGGYEPNVLWYLQVVLENADLTKHEVDYTFFLKTRTILPTAFLCENLEDIKFFMRLARTYYPTSPMKIHCYHGGGNTTAEVFDYLKGLCVPCLVIVDSDIKYPGASKGKTASRCLALNQKELGYVMVKILDVHEAENLLPVEFLKKIGTKKAKAFLKLLSTNDMLDQLVYLDIKEGVKKEDVEDDAKYLAYCEELYNKLYKRKNNAFAKCLAQKKNKTDYVFVPICSKLLDKYNNEKKNAYGEYPIYPDDVISPHRKQIAEIVYTFACCRGYDPIN